MNDLAADWNQLNTATQHGVIAVAIAVGTLYCFLGYRALRFVLALTGFLLAGGAAGTLAAWLSQGHPWITLAAGLIGGFAGAMAISFLYKAGVFLLGGLGGLAVALNILQGRPESWIPIAIVGAGLAGGLLAMLLERPVMTLATAAIGAWMVVGGVAFFFLGQEYLVRLQEQTGADQTGWVLLLSWAALSVIGVFTQFATRSRTQKIVVKG